MASSPHPDALRVLVAIAVTGSIGGAADELRMSQQAASQRLRALEKSLGVALVERSTRGSELTPAGEVALRRAVDVLTSLQGLDDDLARLVAREKPLLVSASLTIAEHLVPEWLLRVSGTPQVHAENSTDVVASVRAGTAHVGFIESTDIPTDLTAIPLGRDELIAVVAAGDEWANRPPLAWAELATRPLVVREKGSGTRQSLDDLLAEEGITLAPAAREAATTAAVRAAAISGVAPAILSRRAVTDDLQLGRLIEVPLERPLLRPLTAVLPVSARDAARDFVAIAASATTDAAGA